LGPTAHTLKTDFSVEVVKYPYLARWPGFTRWWEI